MIGKTVGVNTLKTLLELGLDVWLTKNGVDPAQVRVVEILFSEMGPGLKTDDVRILADPMGLIGPRFVLGAWFTTRQFAEKVPRGDQALRGRDL